MCEMSNSTTADDIFAQLPMPDEDQLMTMDYDIDFANGAQFKLDCNIINQPEYQVQRYIKGVENGLKGLKMN